ncbi:MAG: FHA domain-containing serine/threonine-protein kinase [Candidatus Hydrogenedentota bacterium]
MPGKVKLEVIAGPMKGKPFYFKEHDTFLFGRGTECHASLPSDGFVSRHHFILEVNPPDARIRDLGSLNGTHVNGVQYGGRGAAETPEQAKKKRHPEVDLKHGDQIQVGQTVFIVLIKGRRNVKPVHCQKCGKDVSQEAGHGQGDYVCAACRAKAQNDPLSLLQNMAKGLKKDAHAVIPTIPGYEIGKKIGEGGMGGVYMARRKRDGRVAALKIMLPKIAVDERSREAFLRETNTLRELRHPNIVRLYENGCAGTAFYFIMDYCRRGSIVAFQEQHGEKLSLAAAAPIMLQTLEGLAYAHDRNFVHRDLKPHNLLLDGSRGKKTVKIGDFGLAKNFAKAGYSGMTATGTYSGTFHFMPREQLVNFKYINPASDVWSIAATFYFMLTGAMPRDCRPEQDPMQVVLQEEAVPVRERDPSVPEPVGDVIDRALLADTGERYASAGPFKEALESALSKAGQT